MVDNFGVVEVIFLFSIMIKKFIFIFWFGFEGVLDVWDVFVCNGILIFEILGEVVDVFF